VSSLLVALIGAGSMAAHHARIISRCAGASLAIVVDRDRDRAARLADQWGAASAATMSAVLDCDAAVIATSTPSHSDTALQLISAGLPILVEKPLTSSLAETREVLDAAQANDVALMCGFVERFNPAFLRLAADVGSAISHISTVRIGPAPQRTHSTVVDDVLIHDLDLVCRLTPGDTVTTIRSEALGECDSRGWPETVTCSLTMASGITANLRACRDSPTRQRDVSITQPDAREHIASLLSPAGNPLAAQFEHFCWLVQHGSKAERHRERAGVLPSHEIADLIEQQLARARAELRATCPP